MSKRMRIERCDGCGDWDPTRVVGRKVCKKCISVDPSVCFRCRAAIPPPYVGIVLVYYHKESLEKKYGVEINGKPELFVDEDIPVLFFDKGYVAFRGFLDESVVVRGDITRWKRSNVTSLGQFYETYARWPCCDECRKVLVTHRGQCTQKGELL